MRPAPTPQTEAPQSAPSPFATAPVAVPACAASGKPTALRLKPPAAPHPAAPQAQPSACRHVGDWDSWSYCDSLHRTEKKGDYFRRDAAPPADVLELTCWINAGWTLVTLTIAPAAPPPPPTSPAATSQRERSTAAA